MSRYRFFCETSPTHRPSSSGQPSAIPSMMPSSMPSTQPSSECWNIVIDLIVETSLASSCVHRPSSSDQPSSIPSTQPSCELASYSSFKNIFVARLISTRCIDSTSQFNHPLALNLPRSRPNHLAVSVDILCTQAKQRRLIIPPYFRLQANHRPSHQVCRQVCRRHYRAVSMISRVQEIV